MADVSNKHEPTVSPTPVFPGRSRKLAAWQTELLTTLQGRADVRFRRVKFNELVVPGDYIKDGDHSYQLWDGPRGFRAASFCKPVYRPEPKTHM